MFGRFKNQKSSLDILIDIKKAKTQMYFEYNRSCRKIEIKKKQNKSCIYI